MSKSYMDRLKKYKDAEQTADQIISRILDKQREERLTHLEESANLKEPNEGENDDEKE